MDTKRLVLAFALSAAVLVLWGIFFRPAKPPARPLPTPAAVVPAPEASSAASGLPAGTGSAVPAGPKGGVPAVAAATRAVEPIGAATEEVVTITKPLYTAKVSNRGGALVSFVLSKYEDAQRKPLDLIRHEPPFPGRALTLDPADPFLARADKALHKVEREEDAAQTTVRFRYREADGNGLVRTYVFRAGYLVSMKAERDGSSAPVAVVLGPGIGNPSPADLDSRYTKPGSTVVVTATGSVDRKAKDGLKDAAPLGRGVSVAGLEDNYFLTAFLPLKDASVTLRPVALTKPAAAGAAATKEAESEVVLSSPSPVESEVFLGPKDLDVLESIRPGMGRLIDYGWYAILVKPLLWMLKAIHKFVGNWGVAILLITVVIKVVLYPLTHKQLVSMKKMSRLQPKMEAIRTKWAGKIRQDAQARVKMNEEMMALYKTEGVNPAGGCLPLLLQMPILVAFYNLLAHSIELRHAPFALWIHDLSAKDPYYVTPILMTITMWLQQQLTPPTGDPAMRRVQNLMPFLFGFLFKDVPSGLVLYWLTQNVLTIAQQMILDRYTDLGPSSMKKPS